MGRFSRMNRAGAIVVGALAALLVGTAPAHAYKLANGEVELKGLAFLNFVSVDGNPDPADDDVASGFHYSRTYFEMRYHPERTTTYRITLDSKDAVDEVFVKYAYVQVRVAGETSPYLEFGQNHTPLVDFYQTEIWGHRYLAKTFVDDVGALTAADLGVSLFGDLGDMVEYHGSVMNGEGYNKAPDGAGYSIAGRVGMHTANTRAGVHAHTETDRGGIDGYDPTRVGVYAAYFGDWGNLAAEYLAADDGKLAAAATAAGARFRDGTGYSALVNVNLPAGTSSRAFLRYDSMELTDSDPDPTTLIIVGAETEFHKNILVAVDFQQRDDGTDDVTQIGLHAQVKI